MKTWKERCHSFQQLQKKEKAKILAIGVLLLILPFLMEWIVFGKGKIEFSMLSVLRIGFTYFVYVIILGYYILDRYQAKIKRICEWLLRYRYFIAIGVFLLFVVFQLNISNIGGWRGMGTFPSSNTHTLIGKNKIVRMDEWAVQVPFFFAQAMNDKYYPRVNDNIRMDGQNMLMVYPAPVADLTLFGKPQNLGFLLLGRDFGFTWYWAFRLIFLVLMAIELARIFTKKDPLLSLIGGLWLAFSPTIQWWSSSNLDIYMHGFTIMVIFHYFVHHTEWKVWKQILLGIAMASSIAGFVFCFYPAVQVPLGYVMALFILWELIQCHKKLKAKEYVIMGLSLLLGLAVVGYYIYVSAGDLSLIMNTVYPGKRADPGGNLSLRYMLHYFLNIFTVIGDESSLECIKLNASEASAAIYPFFGLLIMIGYELFHFKKERKNKANWIIYAFVILFGMQLIWTYIGFGETLSKITMFSFSVPYRMVFVIGMIGMMLCLMLLKKHAYNPFISKKIAVLIATCVIVVSHIMIYAFDYQKYLNSTRLLVLYPIVFALTYQLLRCQKKAFCYTLSFTAIAAGMLVNPIEVGTGAIFNTETSKDVQEMRQQETTEKIWLADTDMNAQFLIANGVKVLNGVHYYPNFNWLYLIDPEKKQEEIYNRYAHISVMLAEETKFERTNPDAYLLYITYEDITKLGINYFFSSKKVTPEMQEKFHMTLLKEEKIDQKYIYEIH